MTVGAPLPPSFIGVCEQAGIPVERDNLLGGVWMDGKKALGSDAAPDDDVARVVETLEGKWYWRRQP